MLYRERSSDIVLEMIRNGEMAWTKADIPDLRQAIISRLRDARAAYKGGPSALRFLLQKRGESAEMFRSRTEHFFDKPISRIIVDAHARYLYGTPPDRQYWVGEQRPDRAAQIRALARGETVVQDKRTQALATWFADVYEHNFHKRLFIRGAKLRMRDGMSALKTYLDEDGDDINGVRMDFMGDFGETGPVDDVGCGYEDALPVFDPDDLDFVLAVIETRRRGEVEKYRLWTAQDYTEVGADFEPLAPPVEHPYGRPPFIFFGDGGSVLSRTVGYQKAAINAQSVAHFLVRTQAYPIPVTKGQPLNENVELDGEGKPVRRVGPDKGVQLGPDGDFYFVSPEADVKTVSDYVADVMREALQVSDLPETLLSGDMSAVQPQTLAQMLTPTVGRYRENVAEAESAEDDLTWLLATIAEVYGVDVWGLPGDWQVPRTVSQRAGDNLLDWDIVFPASPLPVDNATEREKDALDVARGLRLATDYIATWVLPGASPEEVAAYAAAIEAKRASIFEAEGAEMPEPTLTDDEEDDDGTA